MAIHISKVYTRGGDKGQTSLVGGERIPKSSLKLEAYGTLDELLCYLGVSRTQLEGTDSGLPAPQSERLSVMLRRIQNELFDVGSMLATPSGSPYLNMPTMEDSQITELEKLMDEFSENLPALNSFTLPGGTPLNASLHVCRSVTRRLERLMCRLSETETLFPNSLKYVNRLSDFFFVLTRYVSALAGANEYLWETPLKRIET